MVPPCCPQVTGISVSQAPCFKGTPTVEVTLTAEMTGEAPSSVSWDFGDNSPTVTSATPTTTHQFTQARTFIIRLTVRDSQNRTSTLTQSLQVATP